jgi:hypothetical protein
MSFAHAVPLRPRRGKTIPLIDPRAHRRDLVVSRRMFVRDLISALGSEQIAQLGVTGLLSERR